MTAPVTARDFVVTLGDLGVDELRSHHVDLAVVAAELAGDAAMNWPWTHDDSTVALLRALTRIAAVAPDATSDRASALRGRMGRTHPSGGSRRGRRATSGASA